MGDRGGTKGVRAEIVRAARRLLDEAGVGALTTRAVAAAAGVQAPTIYRLFGSKDGLVDAVAEDVMAAYVARETEHTDAAAAEDPVDDLRAGWRVHVEFGLANPDLYGLLNAPGRQGRSPATEAGIDVLRRRVHRLAVAGLLRVDEERVTTMIHAAGSGAVLALLQVAPSGRDAGLADALLEAVLDAVLAEPGARPPAPLQAAVTSFGAVLPEVPGFSDAERALMSEWLARSTTHLRSEQDAG